MAQELKNPGEGSVGRLASNSALAFSTNLMARVLKLVFHLIVSRSLGPAGYGVYTLGFNVVSVAQNLATFELDQALIRFLPVYRSKGQGELTQGLLRCAWAFTTFGSIAVGFGLFAMSEYVARTVFHLALLAPAFKVFAISLPFFSWLVVGSATAQAFGDVKSSIFLQDIVFPISALLALAILLWLGVGLLSAPLAFLCGCSAAGLLGVVTALAKGRSDPRVGPRYRLREWTNFSLQMVVVGASAMVFTGLSPLAVALFSGVRSVGIYSAALALTSQSGLLFAGITIVLPAMLARAFGDGNLAEATILLRAAGRWLAFLANPLFIVLVAMAGPLLGLFGPSFGDGVPALRVLACGSYVTTVTVFSGYALVAAGRQQLDMYDHVSVLIAAAIAYPIASHQFGMLGVAAVASGLNIGISSAKVIQVHTVLRVRQVDFGLLRLVVTGVLSLGLYFAVVGSTGMFTFRNQLSWLFICLALYLAAALPQLSVEDRRLARTVINRILGKPGQRGTRRHAED